MGDEGVDQRRCGHLFAFAGGVGLLQGALDEAVFLVGEGRFDIFAQRFGDPLGLAVTDFGPDRVAFATAQRLLGLLVAFEHLHGPVSGREGLGQFVAVEAHVAVELAQTLVDDRPHVDMNVAHALVPVFVNIDYRIEQIVDALVVAGLYRNHRYTQHAAQTVVIERRTAGFELIVHVQCHDHPRVDVDQFGGEVEVALDVRGNDRVDHHVGDLRGEVVTDEPLFGGVGRQGVGAGQIGDLEVVTLVFAVSDLGTDRHAAVVSDVFVTARDGVEERGFAAVGVSDQCHGNRAALAVQHLFARSALVVIAVRCGIVRIAVSGHLADPLGPAGEVFVGFTVREDFDHFGFAAP